MINKELIIFLFTVPHYHIVFHNRLQHTKVMTLFSYTNTMNYKNIEYLYPGNGNVKNRMRAGVQFEC